MGYFTCTKLNEYVTRILCPGNVYAYLVEGKQSAALIDTGCGIGSLKQYVESLTKLPYVVLLTHGHVDHVGGAGEFESVYLNAKDFALAKEHMSVEIRSGYVNKAAIPEEEYILPLSMDCFEPLTDEQSFDLGGVTVIMLDLAGHTAGSMCALINEARTVLLGDACNSFGFLQLPDSLCVSAYHDSLVAFSAHSDRFDNVWYSHPHNIGGKEIVEETIALCEELMLGKRVGAPANEEERANGVLRAKPTDEHDCPLDGSISNFLYKSVF